MQLAIHAACVSKYLCAFSRCMHYDIANAGDMNIDSAALADIFKMAAMQFNLSTTEIG